MHLCFYKYVFHNTYVITFTIGLSLCGLEFTA